MIICEKVIRFGYLKEGLYIRFISLIDKELYFVLGLGKIIVVNYMNLFFDKFCEYKVLFEF